MICLLVWCYHSAYQIVSFMYAKYGRMYESTCAYTYTYTYTYRISIYILHKSHIDMTYCTYNIHIKYIHIKYIYIYYIIIFIYTHICIHITNYNVYQKTSWSNHRMFHPFRLERLGRVATPPWKAIAACWCRTTAAALSLDNCHGTTSLKRQRAFLERVDSSWKFIPVLFVAPPKR